MTVSVPSAAHYLSQSRGSFEAWEDNPADSIDAMQLELMRWQQRNFGDVSPIAKHDIQMTLGLIEEFCECHEAKQLQGKHGKLDALGDICVYAGQLCISHRLALRPILMMAEALFDYWYVLDADHELGDQPAFPDPTVAIGTLAHITLKRDQKIRGYDNNEKFKPEFVQQLATVIALAKVDCFVADEDSIDEPEAQMAWDNLITDTYLKVGAQVLQRNWTVDRSAGQTG
jgi:hypothetical protein